MGAIGDGPCASCSCEALPTIPSSTQCFTPVSSDSQKNLITPAAVGAGVEAGPPVKLGQLSQAMLAVRALAAHVPISSNGNTN